MEGSACCGRVPGCCSSRVIKRNSSLQQIDAGSCVLTLFWDSLPVLAGVDLGAQGYAVNKVNKVLQRTHTWKRARPAGAPAIRPPDCR
jgi:hypothetical protein